MHVALYVDVYIYKDMTFVLQIPVADLNLDKIDSVVAMAYILYYNWSAAKFLFVYNIQQLIWLH